MTAARAVFKAQTSRRLDLVVNPNIPPKGPGSQARAWVRSLGLGRGETAIALAWAWYADGDWQAWPSRQSIARRAGYGVRQVQKLTERLIALGVLIEAGSKVTHSKDGRPIKRTRLYRLAVGRELVPVMPAAARRRLARLEPIESAQSALSNRPKVHFRTASKSREKPPEKPPGESALSALSTGLESAQSAHNPSSNLEAADGAPQTPRGLGQGAPPSTLPTTSSLRVAARERLAELDAAQIAATAERRRRALFVRPAEIDKPATRAWLVPADRQPADGWKDWRRGAKR